MKVFASESTSTCVFAGERGVHRLEGVKGAAARLGATRCGPQPRHLSEGLLPAHPPARLANGTLLKTARREGRGSVSHTYTSTYTCTYAAAPSRKSLHGRRCSSQSPLVPALAAGLTCLCSWCRRSNVGSRWSLQLLEESGLRYCSRWSNVERKWSSL